MTSHDLTHCRTCGKNHPEAIEVCTCDLQIAIRDLRGDRDQWIDTANEWRKDAIRYRNALQDAATSFRKLSDDLYPGCEYRNGWMAYCNECWESAIETLEGKNVTG